MDRDITWNSWNDYSSPQQQNNLYTTKSPINSSAAFNDGIDFNIDMSSKNNNSNYPIEAYGFSSPIINNTNRKSPSSPLFRGATRSPDKRRNLLNSPSADQLDFSFDSLPSIPSPKHNAIYNHNHNDILEYKSSLFVARLVIFLLYIRSYNKK